MHLLSVPRDFFLWLKFSFPVPRKFPFNMSKWHETHDFHRFCTGPCQNSCSPIPLYFELSSLWVPKFRRLGHPLWPSAGPWSPDESRCFYAAGLFIHSRRPVLVFSSLRLICERAFTVSVLCLLRIFGRALCREGPFWDPISLSTRCSAPPITTDRMGPLCRRPRPFVPSRVNCVVSVLSFYDGLFQSLVSCVCLLLTSSASSFPGDHASLCHLSQSSTSCLVTRSPDPAVLRAIFWLDHCHDLKFILL